MNDLRKKFSMDGFLSNAPVPAQQSYTVVLWDIDGSTLTRNVKASSFEDALTRVKAMLPGYGIKSISL